MFCVGSWGLNCCHTWAYCCPLTLTANGSLHGPPLGCDSCSVMGPPCLPVSICWSLEVLQLPGPSGPCRLPSLSSLAVADTTLRGLAVGVWSPPSGMLWTPRLLVSLQVWSMRFGFGYPRCSVHFSRGTLGDPNTIASLFLLPKVAFTLTF